MENNIIKEIRALAIFITFIMLLVLTMQTYFLSDLRDVILKHDSEMTTKHYEILKEITK